MATGIVTLSHDTQGQVHQANVKRLHMSDNCILGDVYCITQGEILMIPAMYTGTQVTSIVTSAI